MWLKETKIHASVATTWSHGELNPDSLLARQQCYRYHYGPINLRLSGVSSMDYSYERKYPERDSNPQNPNFESGIYANSITRANGRGTAIRTQTSGFGDRYATVNTIPLGGP